MSSDSKEKKSRFRKAALTEVESQKNDYAALSKIDQIVSHLQKDFFWYSSLAEQINYCSESIEAVIGYSSDDVKSFNEKRLTLIAKEDIARIREALNEFLTNANTNQIELIYKLEKKDSSVIHLLEKIYANRDVNGEVIDLYGIVSDITTLKEAEERLFETIRSLQKLNEAKDKFVSRISHDLRSPFTSIIGFAEVLINDTELDAKERLEYLNFILQSSKTQFNFVNQLTEIVKLQTHRIKLEPQRTNANRLIHYAVSAFTSQVVDKSLEINVDANEKIHVNVDERLFILLLSSLVSNAVKFSKQGGKIFLKVQEFNEDFVEFIVKDEGVGISEKNKMKIFNIDQIFFSEGTKGEKGSGLGLLLAKEIVEKHGGNIWFYSNINEGSEFHFTIPLSRNAILFVENESTLGEEISQIVKSKFPEYDLLYAKSGYDALNLMSERMPTIIILDHDLPLMTGLQTITNMLNTYKNIKIPMLVVAKNITDDLKKSYSDLGIKKILPKPISIKVLQRELEELVKLFN